MLAGTYRLSKNFFSIGGDYTVEDAAGTTALTFDGKVRFGATFDTLDLGGRVLFTGNEHVLDLDRRFDIARDGIVAATILRETVSGHRTILGSPVYRFVVECPNGDRFDASGTFTESWTLGRDGIIMARIATDGAISEIELVEPTGDPAFIMTVVMAIVRLNPPARHAASDT